jgi:membrane-associated phospholipid phosphatase
MAEPAPGWRMRVRYGGPLAAFWAAGYFTAQAYAVAVFDPMLPIDAMLPFVGAAVWPYVAGIGWIAAPLFLLRSRAALRAAARRYALALSVALACFYLVQTCAPALRPQVQGGDDGASASLLRLLHSVDGPANLTPSLHVALSWLAADALSRHARRWGRPSFAIALAVTVSVMLCKQHTVIDVLAGLGLAALCRTAGPYADRLAAGEPAQPRSSR